MSKHLIFISLCLLLVGCQLGGSDAANQPETRHLANNLIVQQADAPAMIQDGELVAVDPETVELVLPSTDFSYLVHLGNRYTQENGDIIVTNRQEGTSEPLFPTPDREERRIWGIADTWLLVESIPNGTAVDGVGPILAINLDGNGALPVTDDSLSGNPIVSPFNHIIYSTADGAFAWHPDDTREIMPFDSFLSGSFSPDGIYLAVDTGEAIDIFNMARLQHIASVTPSAANSDTPPPPIAWHPNAEWLAYTISEEVDRSVYVANVETLDVKVLPNVVDPQFSPDGEWLAVYDLPRSSIKLVNLETNETLPFGIDGRPILWLE
ncbi:MAG: hypothetical protein AAF614_27635 [Chloroflexota bacterium]